MLCGRVLSFLWSLSTRLKISLGVVWLKDTFRVYTNPLRTLDGLTKKKKTINIIEHVGDTVLISSNLTK